MVEVFVLRRLVASHVHGVSDPERELAVAQAVPFPPSKVALQQKVYIR